MNFFSLLFLSLFLSNLSLTNAKLGFSFHKEHSEPTTNNLYKKHKCNILSLSGGGSYGAVEAGILDSLISNHLINDKFDVITGISAGGLNAGYLSYYSNIRDAIPELFQIYKNTKNGDIYEKDILGILHNWSIYSTKQLYNTLHSYLDPKKNNPEAPITLVGASNIIQNRLDVFRIDNMNVDDKVDVLMSTSAIPFIFPPHKFNGSLYVDGGVISNEMIYEAIGSVDCDYYDIVFISASDHKPIHTEIDGLLTYISSIVHLLFNTFDYQLSEFEGMNCLYPKGNIKACFPNAVELSSYSILDFDYGEKLYELGKNNYYCKNIMLC